MDKEESLKICEKLLRKMWQKKGLNNNSNNYINNNNNDDNPIAFKLLLACLRLLF